MLPWDGGRRYNDLEPKFLTLKLTNPFAMKRITTLCIGSPAGPLQIVWPDGRIKISPISSNVAKNSHSGFYFKSDAFQKAQKISKYLGYFGKKICCQELSDIAQSGRTACRFVN